MTEIQMDALPALEEEAAPPVETPVESARTERDEIMERIYQKRAEQVLREAGHAEPEEPAPEPEPAPPRTTTAAVAPEPQLRTIEINGQQFQVTDDQFLRLAHVGAAMQLQPPPPPPPPSSRSSQTSHRPAMDENRAREFVRRITYGDEDDGARAILELRDNLTSAQPSVDPNQLVAATTQNVMAQMQFHRDLDTIGSEYPDVFASRTLAQLAALTLHEIRGEDRVAGRHRADLEAYREACSRVRAATGGTAPSGRSASSPSSGYRTRLAPRSEPRQLPPRRVELPTRTGSDIVAEMRRSRGQFA